MLTKFTTALALLLAGATVMASSRPQTPSQASTAVSEKVALDAERGTAEIVSGLFSAPPGARRELRALDFLAARQDLFGLRDPHSELRLVREETDNLGMSHVRLEQMYDGLRVWGCQKIVHFSPNDDIYMVAGQNIPSPSIAVKPSLPSSSAEATAVEDINDEIGSFAVRPESELLIYPDNGEPRLAWLVTVNGVNTGGFRYKVFVDAKTGRVLNKYNDIQFDGPAVGSGTDVLGVNRTLQTYQIGSNYQLIDATHPMYVAPVSNLQGVVVTYWNFYKGGPIVTDPNSDNVFSDNTDYRTAVSAHYFTQRTYDYYMNTFGRNSLDGAGMTIIANVHDSAYINNAYWNSTMINFGDGDGTNYLPFSGDPDVVGHELTHGVTEKTANLIYQYQPGALNESMSDFFGNMIDRTTWLIGDNIRISPPFYLRNMQNPHLGPNPTRYPFGYQPATMSEFVNTTTDNGGVHINSGIPNRAGYIMATAITREKAEKIWYRALTMYLTPSSSFNFWAGVLAQSAQDLYGAGSPELAATSMALDSVGFGLVFARPEIITALPVVLGQTSDTTVVVQNRRNESLTISSAVFAHGRMSVTGTIPVTLNNGDSAIFTVIMDASTGYTTCDIGNVLDTLVLTTSSAVVPTVRVPVVASIGYVPAILDTTPVNTSCLQTQVYNDPGLKTFIRSGISTLYAGSLMIGKVSGADTTVYWHLYDPTNFAAVDTFVRSISPTGDSLKTVRFVTGDKQIRGKIRYQYEPSDVAGCGYVTADYWLTNPCGSSVSVMSGIFCDWDINSSSANLVGVDVANKMIYETDASNTIAMGLALLDGTPRNLRAVDNAAAVYDGYTKGEAYKELAATANVIGSSQKDWSSVLSFGQATLGPNDTAHYRMVYLYSTSGSSGLASILASVNAPPSCCFGRTGNVDCDPENKSDISDLSALIDNLYITYAPLCCTKSANTDGSLDGKVDISDLSALIDYLYISFTLPAVCQ
jgi:Zn-dependent metalloprotease